MVDPTNKIIQEKELYIYIYQSLAFTRKLTIGVNGVFGGICKSFYSIVLYKNICSDKTLDSVSSTNLRPTYHEPCSQWLVIKGQ